MANTKKKKAGDKVLVPREDLDYIRDEARMTDGDLGFKDFSIESQERRHLNNIIQWVRRMLGEN